MSLAVTGASALTKKLPARIVNDLAIWPLRRGENGRETISVA